ncbi:glycosyltransferase [Thalassolituus sp.]|uniref:glycosyltransferase n=1 Tax=Thalassolituus sp. TaxID=2030822 RepID=UPI002A823703|nr:glycosyltransferase [Thalassolituus sp.]
MSFSILMSVYSQDNPDYFDKALRSVLVNQTLAPDELVLVIDGPLGSKAENIIQYWIGQSQVPIRLLRKPKNEGLAKALNDGLDLCSNELVFRMDADDISLESRFSRQYTFMLENPDVDVLGAFISEFGDDESEVLSIRKVPVRHGDICKFAKARNPISHPVVCFRKSGVVVAGGYPLMYPEDYMLWINMIQMGAKFANIPEVLLKMRTGESFIKRRGFRFLKGELRSYHYMYNSGFISLFDFIRYSFARSLLRLAPPGLKVLLYRKAR